MNTETTIASPTVSQMVRADYRLADVFKKWGINYCCGGNLPLKEACELKQISLQDVEHDLHLATKRIHISNTLQFDQWPIDFLIDYIVYIHHGYLKQTIPYLRQQMNSFIAGHMKKYPYLAEVEETFIYLTDELLEHTQKEEESIFPYVKQIYNTFNRKETYGSLFIRTMRRPLADIIYQEHGRISTLLLTLREQTNNYQFKTDACTNHQVIYHKLKEFDDDLTQHKHLENNILFPKALDMEKTLLHL